MLMSFLRVIRLIAFWLLDSLALLFPYSQRNCALIVRLDAIGDFVVWLQSGAADVIQELRRTHHEVAIVGNPAWTNLASDLGLFDQVFVIDPKRFMRSPFYRLNRLINLRRWSARTIVMPRAAKVFLQEDEIVRILQATDSVCISGLPINISQRLLSVANRIYTRIIEIPGGIGLHESIRNEAFADGFCAKRGAYISLDILRSNHPPDIEVPYFMIAPGAGSTGRQWPEQKFHDLATQLLQNTELHCVIIGGKSEITIAQNIGFKLERCIDLTGQVSLSHVAKLIAKAKFLIANETGIMHMGVWVGTPTIGLVGGGHFGWFAPYPISYTRANLLHIANKRMPCYGCDWQCSFQVPNNKAFPCVSEIEVSDVVKLALKIQFVPSC